MVCEHCFEMYVPTKCACGALLPMDKRRLALKEVQETLSGWFGGGTAVRGSGFWLSDRIGLVREDVDVVYSNADDSAFREHYDEFLSYAAELAERLGQELIACRIDGTLHLKKPAELKCAHGYILEGTEAGSVARRRAYAYVIAFALSRLNQTVNVGDLFCKLLNYDRASRKVDITAWPRSVRDILQPDSEPEVVAEKHGCEIIFVRTGRDAPQIDKNDVRSVVERILHDNPGWRGIVVFCSPGNSEWSFACPRQSEPDNDLPRPTIREIRFKPQEDVRAVVRRLLSLDASSTLTREELLAQYDSVFDVRGLTDEFYRQYEVVFESIKSKLRGFGAGEDNERHIFTQNLLNRLMFIAFVQKKGWLRFQGSTDYLSELWSDYQSHRGKNGNFYKERLLPLFFEALNCPVDERRNNSTLLGDVPYLNGGLFARNREDELDRVTVPDECIHEVLNTLFAPFDFTIAEGTPLDQQVAVDPEMLGRVFERLVIGRHEKGSYYTPPAIVTYMCREALKASIASMVPYESPDHIRDFIDNRNPAFLQYPGEVLQALNEVRICDPACGSGAYLIGMMQELIELGKSLFNTTALEPLTAYERKLNIIKNNLYGVDLEPVAVNIARLRLWLALAVEFDGNIPPPLPNLDFKIEQGDSLTSPSVSLFEGDRIRLARELEQLQREFTTAGPSKRAALLNAINAKEKELSDHVGTDYLPKGAFDWQVRFGGVFCEGGFHIIITNPPYVRSELIDKRTKAILKATYQDLYDAQADLLVYFYYRALQLLRHNGTMAFISSNKWLRELYGTKLRKYLAEKTVVLSIVDFRDLPVFGKKHLDSRDGKEVLADVMAYPMIMVAQKRSGTSTPRFTDVPELPSSELDPNQLSIRYGIDLPGDAIVESEWILLDPKKVRMIRQMEKSGVSLAAFLSLHLRRDGLAVAVANQIKSGIKTGCTEAFVIDSAAREALLKKEKHSSDLLRPLARGKHVAKWRLKDSDEWLIVVKADTEEQDLRRYSAVWKHLEQYKEKLVNRTDCPNGRWWALRSCDYYDLFRKPRILFQEIATRQSFAYSDEEVLTNNKVLMIPADDRDLLLYLLAVLNSNPAWNYLGATCPRLRGGALALQIPYVNRLPVPNAAVSQRIPLIELALKCVEAAAKGVGCQDWEAEIDERVAALYGLTSTGQTSP